MAIDTSVEMRLARPEDLEEIGRLLPHVAGPLFPERFPGKTAADFCGWKYFSNPVGNAAVGVAVKGNRIVSVVAGTPKRIEVNCESVLAFELGDFITDSQYRKQGLFSSLIQLVCSEAAKRGAGFVYVRPNEISFPVLTKALSFVEAQKIDARRYVAPSGLIHRKLGLSPTVCRILGVDWIARRLVLPSVDGSVSIRPLVGFAAEMDEFWERVRRGYSFALVRDNKYLNWRYVNCPTRYQLWIAHRGDCTAGYLASYVSPAERVGHIVDLFTEPEDMQAAAALLRTAMDAMIADDVHSVHTWTLQTGAMCAGARLLRRVCPLTYKSHLHVAMRFLDKGLTIGHLPSSGWQLMIGDFDGI
jgi:hypothetical protein